MSRVITVLKMAEMMEILDKELDPLGCFLMTTSRQEIAEIFGELDANQDKMLRLARQVDERWNEEKQGVKNTVW